MIVLACAYFRNRMDYNEKILMILLHIQLYMLFNGASTYHGIIEILFGVATLGVITEIAYLAPSHEKLFRAICHRS